MKSSSVDIFTDDNKFTSTGNYGIYEADTKQEFFSMSSTSNGRWEIKNGKLLKHYKDIKLTSFNSNRPDITEEYITEELNNLKKNQKSSLSSI